MALDMLPEYKLERSKDLRRSLEPDFILINHSLDFLKSDNTYSDNMIYDSMKSSHHLFVRLSKREYGYGSDFSHFVIELIGKHYKRIASLGQRYTSPFLRELSEKGKIPAIYTNSILITVLGNYSFEGGDPVEREIYDHLGYQVKDLMRMYRIGRNKVDLLSNVYDGGDDSLSSNDSFNVTESRIDLDRVLMYASKY